MAKHAVEAPRANVFLMDPEKLVLVEDVASALYDERVKLPVKENLVLNIMAHGVLENVLVRKNSETGEVEVVAGRQRVKACIEANKRLKKQGAELLRVPCMFKRGEAGSLMSMMISENEQREDDTPLGRAKKVARLLDLGRSHEEAAVTFGVSVATIKNMLGLLDAPKEVRAAVQKGEISASDGYKLGKMEPAEAKSKLKKLEKLAPKPSEKGKRRPNAKKVREIVSGVVEMRTRKEVEAMREKIAMLVMTPGETKRLLETAFAWVLGNDSALDEFVSMDNHDS